VSAVKKRHFVCLSNKLMHKVPYLKLYVLFLRYSI